MSASAYLSTLPPELAEKIIISTASDGFPTAIAALAQTCHSFRALIYGPSDQHLWREIFLTTFDDPRRLHFMNSTQFNWSLEFQRRVWTEFFLRRHVQPLRVQQVYNLRSNAAPSTVDLTPTYDDASSVKALQTLVLVVKTSAPCGLRYGPVQDRTGSRIPTGSLTHVPPLTHVSHHASTFPVQTDSLSAGLSLSVSWLEATMKHGLPASLISKITGKARKSEWDNTPQAQALGALLSCTGFIPFRAPQLEALADNSSPTAPSVQGGGIPVPSSADPNMTVEAQKARARYCARELVYSLRYLARRRHFGPYLLVPSPEEAALLNDLLAAEGEDLGSLSEYNSETDADSTSSDVSSPISLESDDGSLVDEQPGQNPNGHGQRKRTLPTPEQLVPDWSFLSAARIVLEANMSEHHIPELNELLDWNLWREQTWVRPEIDRTDSAAQDEYYPAASCKEKDPQNGSAKTEWDWAGVEGIWRRCVSWIGYANLIHYNVYGRFDDPSLHENTIIVPMRLRVVGYAPPTIAEYPDRPTILFEGDTGGQDWLGINEDEHDDVRKVHGTVSMVAHGHVRWHMFVASAEHSNEDEWESEAIQVGGVGSGTGFIGLWTGANHESGDPLVSPNSPTPHVRSLLRNYAPEGPIWQWKVA